MALIQDLFRTLRNVPDRIRIGGMTGFILFLSLLPDFIAFVRPRLQSRATAAISS